MSARKPSDAPPVPEVCACGHARKWHGGATKVGCCVAQIHGGYGPRDCTRRRFKPATDAGREAVKR